METKVCHVIKLWTSFQKVSSRLSVQEEHGFPTEDTLCLKIFYEKRFELRYFLVIRILLLKNAYFSSPNQELFKGVWLVQLR